MAEDLAIKLPDGSSRTVPAGSTAADLARAIGSGLRRAAVIAEINGEERDLRAPLDDGDEVADHHGRRAERGLYTIRHSTAHVLAQAVLDLFPGATFGIGPPIEDGFYYDFDLPDGRPLHARRPRAHRRPHARDHRRGAAVRTRRDHRRPRRARCSATTATSSRSSTTPTPTRCRSPSRASCAPTRTRREFIDLCRGPHVEHTGRHLGHFKLTRVAGAYWRGDERNPQLQRIYGTAWASQAGPRRSSPPARGGRAARPPQARRRARPVPLPAARSAAGCPSTTPRAGSSAS